MHSAGVSLSLGFPSSFSFPLTTFVVKNSLDTVCIASSRMSPSKADGVGKGVFRRPEGIYGAPGVCQGALHCFDVCIRWKLLQTCSEFEGDTEVARCMTTDCDPCEFKCCFCRSITPKVHLNGCILLILRAAAMVCHVACAPI